VVGHGLGLWGTQEAGRLPPGEGINVHDPDIINSLPEDSAEEKSKSQRKREAHALQALGERLAGLSPAELERLALPANLVRAVEELRRIGSRGAMKRQRQYIGRLMRELDPEPVARALAALDREQAEEAGVQHRLERWRTRLLEEGDGAVTELVDECPGIDVGRLRTLVRNARREQEQAAPPKAFRALFRFLRESMTE
jgi:ribosome-associated protein